MFDGSLSQFLQNELIDEHRLPLTISVIGSGGKTTLIETIALLGKAQNLNVLVTTTTHMALPSDHMYPFDSYLEGTEDIQFEDENPIVLVGNRTRDRIGPLSDQQFMRLRPHFDVILIESDGARGMDLKYHRENEPVIRFDSDVLLKVLSVKALGKECINSVHNCSLWCDEPHSIIDEMAIHSLAFDERGLNVECPAHKQLLLYNQSDTLKEGELNSLIATGTSLFSKSPYPVVIGSLHNDSIEYISHERVE